MTPLVKYGIKVAGVGLYGLFVSLQAARVAGVDLGVGELEDAIIAGGIGALAFAGLAKTGLENPGGE